MKSQHLSILLPILSHLTSSHSISISQRHKRDPCTVLSSGYSSIDDAPSINSAIEECRTILLPSTETYSILTPLDFSPCRSCDVQLEGALIFSIDADFWGKQSAYISFASARNATFRSVTGTGVINGNAQTLYQRGRSADPYRSHPPLVPIVNATNVKISGLTIENPIQQFFRVDALSSDIAFSDLKLSVENQWRQDIWTRNESIAFQFRNSSSISISNVVVDFRSNDATAKVGVCVGIDYATSEISIASITCNTSDGIHAQFGSIAGNYRSEPADVQWSRHIVVKNYTADTTEASGIKNMLGFQYAKIDNVAFDGVNVINGAPVQGSVCYMVQNGVTNACSIPSYMPNLQANFTDIWFKNYRGKVGQPGLECARNSTCEYHFEGWPSQIAGAAWVVETRM